MRREHIKSEQSPLPSGYTQLKWLGCTGAEGSNHIETDFQALGTFVIRGAVSYYSNIGTGANGTWICGICRGSNRQDGIAMFRAYSSDISATVLGIDTMFGSYVSGYPGAYVIDNTIDTDKIHTFECSRSTIVFDGQSQSRTYTSQSAGNFTLFQTDTNDQYSRTNKHKLYWLSLSDINSGNLLHYFIPAMRDLDSKLGVYDVIGNQFYASIGTAWQYEI